MLPSKRPSNGRHHLVIASTHTHTFTLSHTHVHTYVRACVRIQNLRKQRPRSNVSAVDSAYLIAVEVQVGQRSVNPQHSCAYTHIHNSRSGAKGTPRPARSIFSQPCTCSQACLLLRPARAHTQTPAFSVAPQGPTHTHKLHT